MKNYIHETLNIDPILLDLVILEWKTMHRDEFYSIDRSREIMSPALSKTRTYHLRAPTIDTSKILRTESTQHILEFHNTRLIDSFPGLQSFIQTLGILHTGSLWKILGRIFVTRLDPSENISRHIDEGRYFDQLHRFHIPLQTNGSFFCWDNLPPLPIETGKVYIVNNSIPHWIENGPGYRTHIIFDAC